MSLRQRAGTRSICLEPVLHCPVVVERQRAKRSPHSTRPNPRSRSGKTTDERTVEKYTENSRYRQATPEDSKFPEHVRRGESPPSSKGRDKLDRASRNWKHKNDASSYHLAQSTTPQTYTTSISVTLTWIPVILLAAEAARLARKRCIHFGPFEARSRIESGAESLIYQRLWLFLDLSCEGEHQDEDLAAAPPWSDSLLSDMTSCYSNGDYCSRGQASYPGEKSDLPHFKNESGAGACFARSGATAPRICQRGRSLFADYWIAATIGRRDCAQISSLMLELICYTHRRHAGHAAFEKIVLPTPSGLSG
ncbi:hypothetical protein CPB85DRAFT_1569905 [Mucidula mucida]|nr:hypothetical protein CPB85DRAFT_1569905 [Mucidula mucida]